MTEINWQFIYLKNKISNSKNIMTINKLLNEKYLIIQMNSYELNSRIKVTKLFKSVFSICIRVILHIFQFNIT